MGDVSTWSTTAASNNQTPPDGWPENMLPSQVNDTGREMMAAIRRFYNDVTEQITLGIVKADSGGGLGGYYLDNTQLIVSDGGGGIFFGNNALWTDLAIGSDGANVSIGAGATFRLAQVTVANLPTASALRIGQMMTVTNANAPTYGGTVAGGGSAVVSVVCDGTNWVCR